MLPRSAKAFNPRSFFRKVHRWGAVLVAAPFLLFLATGLLLQLKKQLAWVQPPTTKRSGNVPVIGFDAILVAARSVPEARIETWDDIDRLDVRPNDGIIKVQSRRQWEIQVDSGTGEVVQVAYRRSDLIESLHDGSWFGEGAKLYVFLPAAVIVIGLWATGMYLFVLPYGVRWRRRRERLARGR